MLLLRYPSHGKEGFVWILHEASYRHWRLYWWVPDARWNHCGHVEGAVLSLPHKLAAQRHSSKVWMFRCHMLSSSICSAYAVNADLWCIYINRIRVTYSYFTCCTTYKPLMHYLGLTRCQLPKSRCLGCQTFVLTCSSASTKQRNWIKFLRCITYTSGRWHVHKSLIFLVGKTQMTCT